MTAKDAVEYAFRFIELFTRWPVVFFLVALLYRKELRGVIVNSDSRLTKIDVAGSSIEFSAVTALTQAVDSGADSLKQEPEQLASFVKQQAIKFTQSAGTLLPSGASLRGYSILWVDDKQMGNAYEANLLKNLGASITQARSTKEGMKLFESGSFDLVISDIKRNEDGQSNYRAGYELAEQLNAKGAVIPLIFYTGTARVDPSMARIAFKVTDKPDELIHAVLEALTSNPRKP